MAQKTDKIRIGLLDVAREFWKGARRHKTFFLISYALFFCAQIAVVLIPIYYKKFFDALSGSSATAHALIAILVMVLLLRVANWIFWRFGMYCYNKMESSIMSILRQISFDYILENSHTFFANNFTGGLVQKVNRFSRAFEGVCDTIAFNIIPLVVVFVGSIWVTFFTAPFISLVIVGWVACLVVFNVIFSRWKLKYDNASSEADSATSGYLSDAITNNNAVSFFTGNSHESAGFRKVSDDQARKAFLSWQMGDVTDAVQTFFIFVVEFCVLYYCVRSWSAGIATIGTFVLVQTYVVNLSNQLWGVGRIIRNFYQSLADSKEMIEILMTPHEIRDLPDAATLSPKGGEIVFENVSFGFGGGLVIENLSATIRPRERVAIVGHSGAGKTTIVRLIMRVYDVISGKISIDGRNIAEVTQESLRQAISFVPQDPVLFHRTLLENIRYGKLEATDEEVIEAARLAHCDEFIEKLPLKYDTFVGERGIKLSGGERQRVAIARAILKKAPILIFDEATSSLDSYSESLIQDALETLMKTSTTIIIAHRLSTIRKMDRIISMEGGKIAEEGTHDELANKESGLYKKLWDLQVKGFI